VLFPVGLVLLYLTKIKSIPTPNPEELDNYDRHQTYGTFDIEDINSKFFT